MITVEFFEGFFFNLDRCRRTICVRSAIDSVRYATTTYVMFLLASLMGFLTLGISMSASGGDGVVAHPSYRQADTQRTGPTRLRRILGDLVSARKGT